jgi:hypothetical protein
MLKPWDIFNLLQLCNDIVNDKKANILFIILFEYSINMCNKVKAKLSLCVQHDDIQGIGDIAPLLTSVLDGDK